MPERGDHQNRRARGDNHTAPNAGTVHRDRAGEPPGPRSTAAPYDRRPASSAAKRDQNTAASTSTATAAAITRADPP